VSNPKVKKLHYAFRSGAMMSGLDPDAVGAEIDRIYREKGKATPEEVIERARPIDSPLHKAFEWDDGLAAENYRKMQARKLIKAVVIVNDDNSKASHPAYIHVCTHTEDGDERGYYPMSVTVRDHDMFESALNELTAKFYMAKRSLEDLRSAAEEAGVEPKRHRSILAADVAMRKAEEKVKAIV